MDTRLFLLALMELTLSLVIGVLMVYVTYLVVNRFVKTRFAIGDDNVAFAILTAGILLAVGLTVSGTIQPIFSMVRVLNRQAETSQAILVEVGKYAFLFLSISMVAALVVILSGLYLYLSLTKINEFKEIAANNVAVGLIVGTIVVIIAIFVRDSVGLLLESIIPYPDLPLQPR
ncbi:MAG: DUF350 domain-containing protein [Bernardetiaceae bacterium]|jgi:uncharacterized membrane protein YjfL (UPF0719 family)|nr:DUF350 domain-containing protein [Bernardetiaceae bacterium]